MRRHSIPVLVLLLLTVPAAVVWVRPPRPLGADAEPERFSAARAAEHLEWIAAEPRPSGSEANARVRARLQGELRAFGLEVQEQIGELRGQGEEEGTEGGEEEAEQAEAGRHDPEVIVNVLARRRGSGGGDALLLVAHYDSVPDGPGAGDDGAGVAALLESLRALRDDALRTNDLIVLITDGEELGLFGATFFVREHPWFADVRAVLNFEARGAGGPSILFQVGPASGALVDAYARVAPHPFGTSLAPAVYERMPNDTDFTLFLHEDVPGLNFAFLGGGAAYHRPADRLEELERGSLQHHGEAMTSLVRALGDADLAALGAAQDLEFFPVPGTLARYPRAWTPVLGLVLAVLAAVLCARGSARALLEGVLGALVLVPPVVGGAALTAWSLAVAGRVVCGAVGWFAEAEQGANLLSGELTSVGLWTTAVGTLLYVLSLASAASSDASVRLASVAEGAVLAWAFAAAALPFVVPGAGHVAVLALLGALASRLVLRAREGACLPAFLAWLPAGLVLLPLVPLLVQVGSVTPAREALIGAFGTGLLLLSCLPLLCALVPRVGRGGGMLVILVGFAILGVRALVVAAGA